MDELNLLLVDDEPDVSMLMRMMLKAKAPGFRISSAECGEEALDILSKNSIDCVLCDYQMPGMTGLDLLRELRREGINVPFIFITGQGNEEIASEAFKEGAYDYFTKEIGFAHFPRIINSVEQAVRQRKASEAEARYQAEVLEYSRKLESLSKAARLVNTVLEVPSVLGHLVETAIDLVDGSSGAAGLYEDGRMVFTEYNTGEAVVPIDYSFAQGYGVPGFVMDTMIPYFTADAENDPHVIPEIQNALGFSSLIDVPILNREGRLLGCFEIHNKKTGPGFDARDVELLQGLAASAAIAIDNAMLLKRLDTAKSDWEHTFNAIDDLVTLHDENFVIRRANLSTAKTLGMEIKDIVGRKCYELFHHLGSPITECPGRALLSGIVNMSVHEVEVKGRYFEVSVYPLGIDGGKRGFVHVAKDITERRHAEEARAMSMKMLDAMFETAQFGMMVVGRDKRIRRANRAALKMLGFDSDIELVGRKCHDNICPAETGRCPVLDLGHTVDHSMRIMVDRNGNKVKVLKSVSVMTLGDEEVLLESFVDMRRGAEGFRSAA